MIKLIRRILNISGKYKGRVQLAFVCSFLKAMLAKAPIMLAFLVISAFYNNTATATLCLVTAAAMVLSVLLQALFQHASDRLQAGAGYLIFADKRMELGHHLRRLPMGYFTEGNIGRISSVLSTDMLFVEENCMSQLADMMSYIFAQAIMIVFMLFFNVWLGLIAALTVIAAILLGKHSTKVSMRHSVVRQAQSQQLTESVIDYAEGMGIIKTYNRMGDKSKELQDSFRKSRDTSLDYERAFAPCSRNMNILLGLAVAALVAASILLEVQGLLRVTYLVGMLLFVFDVFGPVKALYNGTARLTVTDACLDRIEHVFDETELPDTGAEHIPAHSDAPEVAFKNVRFGYGEKEVLHDVSFVLPRNQMLALVGPSGGGKSTIASLLTRFWDVQDGQILVRGKDVRNVPLSELMDHISVVFQRVYLFQDTIYNNISMGRPDASREEVIEAAKKARCYDFIMALPDGFDTVVGEGGESLSGGEKQRISIARCILKDAPIVILDEATASVDADNESYIQQAISALCRGKTLLVIAHRLNTIRGADEILVIADGRVAQSGTHDALMAEDGIYRNFITVRENSRGWNA